MKNDIGYQILEPESLDKLIGGIIRVEFKILLLNGILSIIRETEIIRKYNIIALDVIMVNYISKYPAIGVRYSNNENDYGDEIEEYINEIIKSSYIFNLINYIVDNNSLIEEDISKLTKQ